MLWCIVHIHCDVLLQHIAALHFVFFFNFATLHLTFCTAVQRTHLTHVVMHVWVLRCIKLQHAYFLQHTTTHQFWKNEVHATYLLLACVDPLSSRTLNKPFIQVHICADQENVRKLAHSQLTGKTSCFLANTQGCHSFLMLPHTSETVQCFYVQFCAAKFFCFFF